MAYREPGTYTYVCMMMHEGNEMKHSHAQNEAMYDI